MIVVSMVLGALAAFTLATAQAWQQGINTNSSGNGQSIAAIPLIGTLASARLDTEISMPALLPDQTKRYAASAVGGYYPGTLTSSTGQQASLLIWSDLNSDTHIDIGEVELIEYNATDHAIYKYLPTASSPKADTYTTFSSATWIATFKPTATKQALARNIDGMQINVLNPSSSTQLPLVEYRLYFNRGGVTATRYGAVCLRSPETAYLQVLN
jgi:hypothetical protein